MAYNIVEERDTEARANNVYLLTLPIDLTKNTSLHGEPLFSHWGLLVEFIGTEPGDIVYRFVELITKRYGDDPSYKITYNYNSSIGGKGYTMHSSKLYGEGEEQQSHPHFSPRTLFEIIKNHPMNGTEYRAGSNNCQDYVLHILRELGISLNPEVQILSENRFFVASVEFIQDMEGKCERTYNTSKSLVNKSKILVSSVKCCGQSAAPAPVPGTEETESEGRPVGTYKKIKAWFSSLKHCGRNTTPVPVPVRVPVAEEIDIEEL